MIIRVRNNLIKLFGFIVGVFAIYIGLSGTMQPQVVRSVFMLLILPAIFFMQPSGIFNKDSLPEFLLNCSLSMLSFFITGWRLFHWERFNLQISIGIIDTIIGALGIILILEATRRAIGWVLVIIATVSLTYGFIGNMIPIQLLSHRGYTSSDIISMVWYTNEGVFGVALGVIINVVIFFLIFGKMLEANGGSAAFMDIGQAIAGSMVGGAAKVAVFTSSMFGLVSGSTVANVCITGNITIPMMKRTGFPSATAGGIEAVSSCGGQLVPPIMGASAFLMADFVGVSYWSVCVAAAVPALLYYFSFFSNIHFYSKRNGIEGLKREEIPSIKKAWSQYWHLIIPLPIMVVLLSMQYSPMLSVTVAISILLGVSFFKKDTRITASKLFDCLSKAGQGAATVGMICACAGILVGILSLTGLARILSIQIMALSGGVVFVALLFAMLIAMILGMGMPTPAAYIVMAIVAAPALIRMGIEPISSHLFALYFAILGGITPPVALAAYAAAPIAEEDPFKVGIAAIKMGFITFLVPFFFIYNKALVLNDSLFNNILSILLALMGFALIAASFQGFLFSNLSPLKRLIFFVVGVLLLWPNHYFSLIGVLVGIVLIILNRQSYLKSNNLISVGK